MPFPPFLSDLPYFSIDPAIAVRDSRGFIYFVGEAARI